MGAGHCRPALKGDISKHTDGLLGCLDWVDMVFSEYVCLWNDKRNGNDRYDDNGVYNYHYQSCSNRWYARVSVVSIVFCEWIVWSC